MYLLYIYLCIYFSAVVENGDGEEDGEMVTEEEKRERHRDELFKSPKAKKFWKAIKSNMSDFTSWTCLLQTVEQEVKYLHLLRYLHNFMYIHSELHYLSLWYLLFHILRYITFQYFYLYSEIHYSFYIFCYFTFYMMDQDLND